MTSTMETAIKHHSHCSWLKHKSHKTAHEKQKQFKQAKQIRTLRTKPRRITVANMQERIITNKTKRTSSTRMLIRANCLAVISFGLILLLAASIQTSDSASVTGLAGTKHKSSSSLAQRDRGEFFSLITCFFF